MFHRALMLLASLPPLTSIAPLAAAPVMPAATAAVMTDPDVGPPVTGHGTGGTYRGPGDTVAPGAGPSSSPTSVPMGPANPSPAPGGPAPGPSSSAPRPPSLPTPLNLTTESDDGWWLWWEYNKIEFLRPNRQGMWGIPATGDFESSFETRTAAVRGLIEPMLAASLEHPDGIVRAEAVLALARIAGDRAVQPLLAKLSDPNSLVRERAILGLGATGSAAATLPLLSIARYGSLDPESGGRILPAGSGLAIVALAFGRRAGLDQRTDAEVANLAANRGRHDHENVAVGALIYQVLVPCDELAAFAARAAEDEKESPIIRCRAVESLRSASDDRTVSRLRHYLSGDRMDLRRSAALALGEIENPQALPSLTTAFELESEPLTRGFILISIGRQGGISASATDTARAFLLRVLREERASMRRWSALALGLLSRSRPGDAVNKAIRDAAVREKSRDAMGAYWIASALARDEMARPAIRDGLTSAADPRQRMYASVALALIGGDPAASALENRLAAESSPLVLVSIAGAIGVLGRPEQAPGLLRVLQGLREPDLQGLAASALAFHGSLEALQALMATARLEGGSVVRRAAAIEGLGMMLCSSPPLTLGQVSRQANYTVFNDWVKDLFQVTL